MNFSEFFTHSKVAFMATTVIAVVSQPGLGTAEPLFNVTVTSNGTTTETAFTNALDFVDQTTTSAGIAGLNPNYTTTSTATVLGDFRGVDYSLVYPDSGSTLRFSIPDLDISQTFSEQTRELSEDALDDYLVSNQDGILTRIGELLVQTTATDPVAGNPTSLQANMISSDFGLGSGFGGSGSVKVNDDNTVEESAGGIPGLAARLGRFSVDGADGTVIELPISYVKPLADPRWAVVLEMPLTYVDIGGSQSYSASLGGGLRIPVLDNWSLTPSLRVGGVGSDDFGAFAYMYSGSLTSSFRFNALGLDFNLGNMLSYISTTGSPGSGEKSPDYDLQNTVARNGLSASGRTTWRLFDQPTTWEASIVNTQIFGDDVYIDNYTDFAISLGTERSQNGLTWDAARLGITYSIGNHGYKKVNVNFGYQF
ncbi:hypothetical protein SAMN06265373_11095 [Shimia sagamensis]|uniref:Autotransporter domain-containing protein n=2 Tax=Shimia sagamensis TaxID=1566352 RepID=A0ABY1PIA4_9RHOB|nr:hypothetical protein SAMN06265373_11095 [Shimia sagamensis]